MNTAKMRSALAEVYSGASWKDRVQCMSEEQVLATYKRMEREGQLFKHSRRTEHIHVNVPTNPDLPMYDPFFDLREHITTDSEGRVYYCSPGP